MRIPTVICLLLYAACKHVHASVVGRALDPSTMEVLLTVPRQYSTHGEDEGYTRDMMAQLVEVYPGT
jgi:hypothetical protein